MNMIKYFLLLLSTISFGQTTFTMSGKLDFSGNQQIALKGFSGNEEVLLATSTTDDAGNFKLDYPAQYIGAAILEVQKMRKLIVLLNHENFTINWTDDKNISTLQFLNSQENIRFDEGFKLLQSTEAKKSGINYLLPLYQNDGKKLSFFNTELNELNAAIPSFLKKLSPDSYVIYYFNLRLLLADLQKTVKSPELKAQLDQRFRSLNFDDANLLHSGLYYELLDNYFLALENQGEVDSKMNDAADLILQTLQSNPNLKQQVAQYLFTTFEKRSLFDNAKHIAISMLNDESCQLDDKHKALFEQYRKMAIGNTATDIKFTALKSGLTKLSDIKSKFKLVVFGASWCPKCVEEIPALHSYYQKWKKDFDLEIVFISLDTQQSEYATFTKDFPWISSADYKGWETQAAVDYSIFATPTMYLLDVNNKIQLKPISAEQVDAWIKLAK